MLTQQNKKAFAISGIIDNLSSLRHLHQYEFIEQDCRD